MTIAVLDFGKTNTKLVLFDDENREIFSTTRSNEVETKGPYPHFDLEGHQEWVLNSLSDLPEKQKVRFIIPVTHGAAAVLVRADGTPSLPMLDYEHSGPDEIGAEFAGAVDSFDKSFTPDLPQGLALGRQLFWQQQRFPEQFAQTSDVLFYPQYWSFWLSGVRASEATSFGCHSHLWFAKEGKPADFVRRQGWEHLFPAPRRAYEPLGSVRRYIAEKTGLPVTCRVLTGIHDSNASLLPYLRSEKTPFTVVSTGTWVINMAVGGDLNCLDQKRDMIASVDVEGRPVPTQRFMGGREYEAIAGEGGLKAFHDISGIRDLVKNGSMALPAFVQGVGAFPECAGRMIGPEVQNPQERASLASLYSALMIDFSLDLLEVSGTIFVDGPFASNLPLLQTLATLRPKDKICARASTSGAAAGASLLANWQDHRANSALSDVVDVGPITEFQELSEYKKNWQELADNSGAP